MDTVMTQKNRPPYSIKQSATEHILGEPDSNSKTPCSLRSDSNLPINFCLDAINAADRVPVVKAINFLKECGLSVIISRGASHLDEPQYRLAPPKFLKLETVSAQTGMGKSTILAWESTGRFPRAVRLSSTIRVWLEDDVLKWILSQHARTPRHLPNSLPTEEPQHSLREAL